MEIVKIKSFEMQAAVASVTVSLARTTKKDKAREKWWRKKYDQKGSASTQDYKES